MENFVEHLSNKIVNDQVNILLSICLAPTHFTPGVPEDRVWLPGHRALNQREDCDLHDPPRPQALLLEP